MSDTFFGLSVDCADAATLAQFWADVLGRGLAADPSSESAVVTVEAEGIHGPRLGFHRVPEPKSVKNRLHLDLITTEFDAETSVCSVWAPGASKTWNRAAPAGRRSPTSRATNSTSSRAELS